MSLLIAFQNLLFKKITFLNETKRPLCHGILIIKKNILMHYVEGGLHGRTVMKINTILEHLLY